MIHTVILAIKKKSNIFILREFCKITHFPPIVTLALLLFACILKTVYCSFELSVVLLVLPPPPFDLLNKELITHEEKYEEKYQDIVGKLFSLSGTVMLKYYVEKFAP